MMRFILNLFRRRATVDQMTIDQRLQYVVHVFPAAELYTDSDGQLVIYTNIHIGSWDHEDYSNIKVEL